MAAGLGVTRPRRRGRAPPEVRLVPGSPRGALPLDERAYAGPVTGSQPQTDAQPADLRVGPGAGDRTDAPPAEGAGGPDRELVLEAHPRSAGRARAYVAQRVMPVASQAATDAAVLLTSELVTNAVLHARGDVHLSVELTSDEVRIEVVDSSPTSPAVQTPRVDATGGRGLILVQSMSKRWGSRLVPGGKAVWFELGL